MRKSGPDPWENFSAIRRSDVGHVRHLKELMPGDGLSKRRKRMVKSEEEFHQGLVIVALWDKFRNWIQQINLVGLAEAH